MGTPPRCPVLSGIEVSILRYLIQACTLLILLYRILIAQYKCGLQQLRIIEFCSVQYFPMCHPWELPSWITELRVILYQILEHRLL